MVRSLLEILDSGLVVVHRCVPSKKNAVGQIQYRITAKVSYRFYLSRDITCDFSHVKRTVECTLQFYLIEQRNCYREKANSTLK